jgi:hypothetical protein
MNNLEANPSRQAVPTLKGYTYQIWQSVLQWLELEDNQQIFLEGAEDIDLLIEPNQAKIIQVKATATVVTLGLATTSEVINNFWEHQQKNPSIQIVFKYLTTSERGFEQGNPFKGIKGLDFWDSCRFPNVDTSLLRAFLKKSSNFSPDLQKFLAESSEEDLRQKLIIPIEWDTGNRPIEYLEEMIVNKVVIHGDRVLDLPPHISKKVIPNLLKHTWEVICKTENRWLYRQDFLEIFENSTMELVRRDEYREIQRTHNHLKVNPFV